MNMKNAGLTLIELIVTLAVISILLVLGVPQFKSTTSNSRLTTAINTLTGDLAFARTEAIKRGISVAVTGSTNWATSGWTVAENISGGAKLRISPALTAGANITTNPTNTTTVSFNTDGRSSAVTFTLCDDRSGNFGKRVSLTTTGQTFLTTKISCKP